MLYLESDQKFRKDSAKSVEKALMKEGFSSAYLLYDEQGNLRSKKEFTKMASRKIGPEAAKDYEKYLQYVKFKEDTPAIQRISSLLKKIPGANTEAFRKSIYYSNLVSPLAWLEKGIEAIIPGVGPIGKDALTKELSYTPVGLIAAAMDFMSPKDKINPYDPKVNANVKKILDNYDYDDLVSKAGKKYSDSKVVKAIPARLSLGPLDKGTGLFTVGSSRITVNPKGMSAGKAHFGEAIDALKNFDWGGSDVFTFGNLTKDNYDKAKGIQSIRAAQGQKLLSDLMLDFEKAQQKGGKTKLSQFGLKVSPIAGGNSKFASITIIPNKEWLDQYLSKNTKTPENLLTAGDYKKAMTNGLTFIMDNSKLNNVTMYKQAYTSPMASYIETFRKYELNDIGGDPMKRYVVTPNTYGTGDYVTTVYYPKYNPNTGIVEQGHTTVNTGLQGGLLESNRDQMINWLMQNDDQINYLHNNYYQGE
jgi:hypothetical protein